MCRVPISSTWLARLVAVLDANVPFPDRLRDLLLRLAIGVKQALLAGRAQIQGLARGR